MAFGDVVFWLFAAIAVLPAFLILISRSIVRMAFLLLFSLAGFAGLYLQLGAGFVGFTQVMVYIGGILILFLFGVMLTQRSDIPVRPKAGPALVIPGLLAGASALAALVFIAAQCPWKPAAPLTAPPADSSRQIGLELLSTYVLPFEAVSILLLVAMVGATYIARVQAPGGTEDGMGDAGKESVAG
jgi:NADH-quinone oxidoreductase subunit J